jgi:hypothetical protein
MTILQCGFFFLLGLGLLLMIYRSFDTVWLACGSNGLKGRFELRRDEHPAGYWLVFCAYGVVGLGLLAHGLSLLAA